MSPSRLLCRLDDIPDRGCKGFPPAPGSFTGLFAVRHGDDVHVYVNACPHLGSALDRVPDCFLSPDRRYIVCSTHGARFRIADGECLSGPPRGSCLEAVPVEIKDGTLYVPADAGL